MLAQHATSMKTPVLLSIKVFMGDERTPQLTAETFYPFFILFYFVEDVNTNDSSQEKIKT